MPHYIIGNNPPDMQSDAHQETHCRDLPSPGVYAYKRAILSVLPESIVVLGPNAAEHMLHYLMGHGIDKHVDMMDYMIKSKELRRQFLSEMGEAKIFAEKLPPGDFSITSSKVDSGDFSHTTDWMGGGMDLHYAVGGYKFWGQANIKVKNTNDGKHECDMVFRFHFYDRYNWNQGQMTKPFGIPIEDNDLKRISTQCLAKEFNIRGLVESKVSWRYIPSNVVKNVPQNNVAPSRENETQRKYNYEPLRH